ncbi:MAG: antibiotic biosynthesis monooxygenase family protein [Candidatus Dormiibacterota bacterium]
MYGSVSRWRIKEGQEQELLEVMGNALKDLPPGSHGVSVYRSDTDPQEFWVAGSWESKEAYRANSNTPEQDASYRRLRDLMDADPEWHDGEIVFSRP